MVGIIDDTCILYPIGSRIQVGDYSATVKYVGEVSGHQGSWLGIEWDDPKRGKHNGHVGGKNYFHSNHPTGGSFIRPSKIEPFDSLEDAARKRYLCYSSNNLDQSLMREAQQSLQASIFEVVGMEKIARKQSRFEQLMDISVDNSPVNSAGYLKDFTSLTNLNLSRTLIWNWETIADITKQIPTLINLNLSCNRFVLPTDAQIVELEPAFRSLQHINLSNCGFKDWDDVTKTARLWPNILSLALEENAISVLSEVNCREIFKKLKELDLHCTKIMDFDQVCKLGNIKTLASLNLMENGIEEIKLPDCEPNSKLNIFLGLEQLNLLHNTIWNEADAFNELDKLPNLKRLSKTPCLKSNFDEMFSKAVGAIPHLEVVNKVQISAEERRFAEYDMWKKYAFEWIEASKNPGTLHEFYKRHRSYVNIIRKCGSPAEFVQPIVTNVSNLIKICIKNDKTGEVWEKKVPRMITVQTLYGLIAKRFNLKYIVMPQLKYVDANNPKIVVILDNPSKTLDFYSIQDNDTVIVD